MIQRLQTVYLLLAVASVALFNFIALGVDETPHPDKIVYTSDLNPLLIISVLAGIFCVVAMLLYRDRKLQMKVCRIAILLFFFQIGLMTYLLYFQEGYALEIPGIGLVMPVFGVIFTFLSLKRIGHDEKLVSSMDRLR